MLIELAVLIASSLAATQDERSVTLIGTLNPPPADVGRLIAYIDTRTPWEIQSRQTKLEVDRSGRFIAKMISPAMHKEAHGYDLTVRESGTGRAGRIHWTMIPSYGERDVGSLLLQEPPVLVGGHVFLDSGEPVAGAHLDVHAFTPTSEGVERTSSCPT
ncbi:MAG: hypothetical protein ACI841_000255 [Planctomycetota bacterium]|jgi:hypothetical protein